MEKNWKLKDFLNSESGGKTNAGERIIASWEKAREKSMKHYIKPSSV